jgi:hypothetical protein
VQATVRAQKFPVQTTVLVQTTVRAQKIPVQTIVQVHKILILKMIRV